MPYEIEITASTACGCRAQMSYALGDEEPKPGTVAGVLIGALDPDEPGLFEFLTTGHRHGGDEKITVTAQVKVR